MEHSILSRVFLAPIALRRTKIVYNSGPSECNRVKFEQAYVNPLHCSKRILLPVNPNLEQSADELRQPHVSSSRNQFLTFSTFIFV